MQHQQWEPVVFSNRPSAQAAKAPPSTIDGASVLTPRNRTGPGPTITTCGKSAAALEKETEELKHQFVSAGLKKAIQQARQSKQLTQKQLAMQLNITPQTVQLYEAGKAIPNNSLIAKMERTLGAKLPRAAKK